MLHYAVIGDPVSHSRSPEIYNALFEAYGVDADFSRLRVAAGELASLRSKVEGLSGFAVTMPHKRAILPMLNGLSPQAELIGAVNIVERKGADLIGHNTDGAGLADALNAGGVDPSGKNVLILGRGGAALSAAYALKNAGASVALLVRGYGAFADFPEVIFDPRCAALPPCDVFINATPLGMEGRGDFEGFGFLKSAAPYAVFDMVYRTDGPTRLVEAARGMGALTFGGREMLLYQALRAFYIWTGIRPDPSAAGPIE